MAIALADYDMPYSSGTAREIDDAKDRALSGCRQYARDQGRDAAGCRIETWHCNSDLRR